MLKIYTLFGLLGTALTLLWLPVPSWLLAALLTLALLLVLLEWHAQLNYVDDHLAATVFDISGNGIMITDRDNHVLAVNSAFTAITGYSPEEIVGKNPRLLSSGRQDPSFYATLWHTLKTVGMWQGEIWNRNKNGAAFVEWLTINAVKDKHGEITHHIAIFSDITERKVQAERLEYLATHDALTDLSNRAMFNQLLSKTLADARRTQSLVAVLFLDLDKFKQVNDTLGHAVGDLLLQTVAKSLRGTLRASDIVARQGGDEFTIALSHLASTQDANQLADKILRSLEQPCILQGQTVQVTISIGVALFPQDGIDSETLLKNADAALYRAKQAGRNNVQFFKSPEAATTSANS